MFFGPLFTYCTVPAYGQSVTEGFGFLEGFSLLLPKFFPVSAYACVQELNFNYNL